METVNGAVPTLATLGHVPGAESTWTSDETEFGDAGEGILRACGC
jgi:hypothetical protein